MKKASVVMVLILLLSAFTVSVSAKDAVKDSGKCGDNITWNITESNKLTISGTGKMEGEFGWRKYCEEIKEVVISSGITTIGESAFSVCLALEKVSIPNTVTVIEEDAFVKCHSLENITIPDSVTVIEGGAFAKSYGLENVILSQNLKSIGAGAFARCPLVELQLPQSLSSIGEVCFSECQFKNLDIPQNVSYIGRGAFSPNIIETLEVDENNEFYHSKGNCLIETQTKVLIAGCSNSIIPSDNSVECIGESAFKYSKLEEIILPDSIKTIEEYAFTSCDNLKTLVIPNGTKIIGEGAFYGCSYLEEIFLPDSLTSIGEDAIGYGRIITTVYASKGSCGEEYILSQTEERANLEFCDINSQEQEVNPQSRFLKIGVPIILIVLAAAFTVLIVLKKKKINK